MFERPYMKANFNSRIWKPSPTDQCVLYCNLLNDYGSSTLRDISGSTNNGTVNGAIWSHLPSGMPDLYFDGSNDRISFSKNASKGLTGLTMFTWICPTDISATQAIMGDFTSATDCSFAWEVGDMPATSTYRLNIFINGKNVAGEYKTSVVSTHPYGIWAFVGVTWDGSNVVHYYNGTGEGNLAYVDTQLESTVTQNTVYGAFKDASSAENMSGYGTGISIFGKALSAGQINGIFQFERSLFGV